MRVAMTYDYDTGEIFQHFGRSEFFKVYDIEEDEIIQEAVYTTNGQGHGALAGALAYLNVDVLVCGGIGMGAQNALSAQGITLYAGASGNCDDVIKVFMSGNLEQGESNCHHHDHEGGCGHHEGGCGHHDEGGCCH